MGREGQDETGRRIKRFHGWTHSVCRNVFHTMDYLLTNSAFVRDQAGWTWIGLLVRFRVRLFVSAPGCRCKGGKWTSRGAFTTSSPAASTSSGEVQTNPRLSTPSKSGLGPWPRSCLRLPHSSGLGLETCCPGQAREVQRQEDETSQVLMRNV